MQRLESMTLHQCVCYSGKFNLYCTVGIAMTGIHYSLYVLSYRMPAKLTGDALMSWDLISCQLKLSGRL